MGKIATFVAGTVLPAFVAVVLTTLGATSPGEFMVVRACIVFAVCTVAILIIWTLFKDASAIWHYILGAAVLASLVYVVPVLRWVDDKEIASQLNRYTGVLFAPGEAGPEPLLEVGTSGQWLDRKRIGRPATPADTLLLPALTERQFKIERVNGKIKVSTEIADENGKLIARLDRNEWRVAPSPMTWDRNYTADALEVIDPTGAVVLQVKVLSDRIRLQGVWWWDMGPPNGMVHFVVRGNPSIRSQIAIIGREARNFGIDAMFVYPSDRHLGELK